MANDKIKKIDIFHKPDWHPDLSSLLGDLRGNYGYVTDIGTISLIGPDSRKPAEISKFQHETDTAGALYALTASGVI